MTNQRELNTKNCIEDLQHSREEFENESQKMQAEFCRQLEDLVIRFRKRSDEILKKYGVRDEDKTRDTKR
jgi:hypothetical protein